MRPSICMSSPSFSQTALYMLPLLRIKIKFNPSIIILFLNVNIRNANRVWATASISTVISCFLNNRNFIRWKIAPPGRDTFQFMVWDTGSGDIDILFVKVNIRNANRARATAPLSFLTYPVMCGEKLLIQSQTSTVQSLKFVNRLID